MRLKDLPIGSAVTEKRSKLCFLVAALKHPGYEGTTLVSRDIVRVACFDAREPDSKGKGIFENAGKYGSNNYALSNINQWLNSGETYWYSPTHDTDTPPKEPWLKYGEQPNFEINGFLRELSTGFVSAMIESEVPTLTRTSFEKGEIRNVKAKIFLPSRTELGLGNESGFAEGASLPLFEGRNNLLAKPTATQMAIHGRSWNPGWDYGMRSAAKLDDPQIYDPKFGWWYWTRTPHLSYAYLIRVMSAYGALSYTLAYNDIVGVRPMLNIASDIEVDETGMLKT